MRHLGRHYATSCSAHFLVQMLVVAVHWGAGAHAMTHSPFGRWLTRAEFWLTMPFVPMLQARGLDPLVPFAWLPNSLVWGLALFVVSLPLAWRK